MAVLEMQRIGICAMKKDRKKLLELLQQKGVVEIDAHVEEDEVFKKMDTSSSRNIFEKNAQAAERALEILQEYVPEKKGMLASLEGKALVDARSYDSVIKRQDAIMSKARQLVSLSRQIAENKANIQKRENQIEALEPWKNLDVPMNFMGTRKTEGFVGTVSELMNTEQLYAAVTQAVPDVDAFFAEVISTDRDQTYLCVICGKKDAPVMEEGLRSIGFARPSQIGSLLPADRQEQLRGKREALIQKNEEIISQIAAFAEARRDLELVADYYRVRLDKYEVLGGLIQSKSTFLITGYVPKRDGESLKQELERNFTLSVEVADVEEEDIPPILLKNGKLAASFEGVVESFGLPGKGEIDPTAIMAWCYIFLFGLMLSDAAYGLMVFLACAIVLKKFPRMGEGMQKSLRLFMYCGISTLVWGVLFGGYFGDVVDVVSRTFFGQQVTIKALWFVPLNDPMKMLVYSMLFGLIHMFLGLGLKAYMLIRDKKYLDCFCDVGLWVIFLMGLILMFLPSSMFASISQMYFTFPPAVNTLAKAMAIGGAAGICLMSGRDNKNFALRIALGAYDLYNVTGWLSDVLSYSRLLALGLATGVIASVINSMGSMAGSGVVGAIVFILVFVVGHVLNLAINILGAYVHTNRLQYVEFFGKFYEGGGRPFNPFNMKTKYVDIKEEN